MADFLIRPETPADYRAVEALTREAFWNVYRPGCLEHYLVHRYRGREGFGAGIGPGFGNERPARGAHHVRGMPPSIPTAGRSCP